MSLVPERPSAERVTHVTQSSRERYGGLAGRGVDDT